MIIIQWTCHACVDFSLRQRSIKFPKPLLHMSNMRLIYWQCCEWNLRTAIFLLKMSLCLLQEGTAARLYKIFLKTSRDENKLASWGRWRNGTFIVWLQRDQHSQLESEHFQLFPQPERLQVVPRQFLHFVSWPRQAWPGPWGVKGHRRHVSGFHSHHSRGC